MNEVEEITEPIEKWEPEDLELRRWEMREAAGEVFDTLPFYAPTGFDN